MIYRPIPHLVKPSAFLAIWNCADSEFEKEYETWHAFEHVPERTALPGFVEGRRYRNIKQSLCNYFTLYVVEAASALETPAYRMVQDQPTEWSIKMRGVMRNFRRVPCVIKGEVGASTATFSLVYCFDFMQRDAQRCSAIVSKCAQFPGILRSVWGTTDGTSQYGVVGLGDQATNRRPVSRDCQRWVVIHEAISLNYLHALNAFLSESLNGSETIIEPPQLYQIQSVTLHRDVAALTGAYMDSGRLLPRNDLYQKYI
jgi:hypothetical protein